MSNSTVISICKDDLGFMWFGTRYGLNRFDGNIVKTYLNEPGNPNSLSCNDYIYAVINDGKGGIWAGTKNGLNHYIVRTDNFERFLHDSTPVSLSDNLVNCMLLGHGGDLWVGTANGLNLLKNKNNDFERFLTRTSSTTCLRNQVITLFEDKWRNIWVGTKDGIYRLWFQGQDWHQEYYGNNKGIGGAIRSISEDVSGDLWIGTEQGNIYFYDRHNNDFSNFKLQNYTYSNTNDNIRRIFVDKGGLLWIATIKGLKIYDIGKRTESLEWISQTLKNKSIKSIYQDDQGNIWLGTMYQGVYAINPAALAFHSYHYNSNNPNSLSGDVISALLSTETGIWIGTEGNGLNLLNPQTGTVRRINDANSNSSEESISGDFIKTLLSDKSGYIWIGTYLSGIKKYIPSKNTFTYYRQTKDSNTSLSSNYVSALIEDKRGRIWAGTENGINLYDPTKDCFYPVNSQKKFGSKLLSENITCLYEDVQQRLWIGTTEGLHFYDENRRQFVRFYKKNALTSLYINCIKEDKLGNIWIGTYGDGVYLLKVGTNKIQRFTVHNGLPSNNIRAIEIDHAQTLWISTDHGLSNFNTEKHIFYNYGIKDGLPIEEFSARSAILGSYNTLYFGSYDGLVYFKDQHFLNQNAPSIVITDLKIFNKSVHINNKNGVLMENMVSTPRITLQHDQNVFSLSFAALNYIQPERNTYAYKLQGFDKQWIHTKQHVATYMNLPSGRYIFLLRGANNDGVWGKETSIEIVILPPWWRKWWAYCIYVLLVGSIVTYVIWSLKKRIELKNDIYLKNWKNIQTQKQYEAKMDFFTHISHEIRTPLTLITAPLDQIMEETKSNSTVEKQMGFVRRNADQLLKLVNELLDFRKLDSGVQPQQIDTIEFGDFCRGICDAFQPLVSLKDINLSFQNTFNGPLYVDVDSEQMEKVISNLIINAQKFTTNGGQIEVRLEVKRDSHLVIFHIWDTGIGIEDAAKPYLFEKFYQGKNHNNNQQGWGIGLSMAKYLLELQGGEIWLESFPESIDPLAVTCFTFSLPISETSVSSASREYLQLVDSPIVLRDNGFLEDQSLRHNYTVMVVEDNTEMRNFMHDSLSSEYNIIMADDGVQAEKLLLEHLPDLVISDIAMPYKNGLQLCASIKEDIRTSHIPVILLTARSTVENQIEGLTLGANAYITKPFSVKVLELTVRNTLEHIRAIRQQYFQEQGFKEISATELLDDQIPKDISALDFQFLDLLRQIVITEMENPDFNITDLVKKMGMSRTVIFKKVKALTDMNIQEFSKSTRLAEAASMLKEMNKDFTISDISYKTGFSDPKYFSKEFKKQYGLTPSEFNKKVHSI